jgi:hypothetical protein
MEIIIEFKFNSWVVRKDYSTTPTFVNNDYNKALKYAIIMADVLKVNVRKINGGDSKIVYPEAQ